MKTITLHFSFNSPISLLLVLLAADASRVPGSTPKSWNQQHERRPNGRRFQNLARFGRASSG